MSISPETRPDLGLTQAGLAPVDEASAGGCCGGGCCGGSAEAAPDLAATAGATTYLVEGMTCAHCVSSVTKEFSVLSGVEAVTVELNTGGASAVTVARAQPLDPQSARDAIERAGYTLVES